MTKVEIGTVITAIIAIATTAFYIGKLDKRVAVLEEFATSVNVEAIVAAEVEKNNPVPPQAILAWVGREEKIPTGWVICGQKDTLDLDGRFLIGTNDWNEVGTLIGSDTHQHPVDIKSGFEVDGTRHGPEGADNWTGKPNWNHKHRISGRTELVEHIPPSVTVFFLCKE